MRTALIDNGSLAAAAHRHLRQVADAVAERAGHPVAAVSWKHSDRIAPGELGGAPAWTLPAWIEAELAAGEREFLFIPYFISPHGAIGSALQRDLEILRGELGDFAFSFTDGLGGSRPPGASSVARRRPEVAGHLVDIISDRIGQAIAAHRLTRPPVIIVDHGGPSAASAAIRDSVAVEVRAELGGLVRCLSAASMESPDGPDFAFNRPLLADLLGTADYGQGEVLIAPLFLSPGRHAGPGGDLARIARAAESARPGLRCRFAELVGTHPRVPKILADGLRSGRSAKREDGFSPEAKRRGEPSRAPLRAMRRTIRKDFALQPVAQ